MQPRLVAISYPSAEAENDKRKRFSVFKPFRRAKSEAEAYPDPHARWSSKLRRFTWHDLKSQVTLSGRKRSKIDGDVTLEVAQPWSEAFLHDSGFASRTSINEPNAPKWQSLPSSIQTVIIKHVESTYSHIPSANAYALRRRDVMALQSCCKAWSTVAQRRLYETIQLKPNYDYDWSTAPPKIRHTRLLQLRRTLRSNARLADLVKHLMLLPENQDPEEEKTAYSDLVASIVIVCPNLQSLTSFHVPYTHTFDRLHHALASRTELRKHTWIVGEDQVVRTRAGRRYSSGILSSQQTRLFIHYHALWKNLEEINLISHNGKGILEHNLFVKTFNMLPALQRLHVSCFDANDFSDETLLSLPPLTSLRIDRCPGVTEMGLCQWAQSPEAAGIQRLVLESQHITSLLTVAAIFSTLPRLETFRMVQLEFEPSLPLELDVKQPLFESASLKTLEWFVACGWDPDINKYQDTSDPEKLHDQLQTWSHSKATQNILSSILDYGFPALRNILLPGYGNLSGLLRWVRHTAPETQPEDLGLKERPTLPNHPHSAPLVRLRRNGSRLSLRPASPTFMEYDHWQRLPLFNVPEMSHSTIVEQSTPTSPVSPMRKEEAEATHDYLDLPSPSPFEHASRYLHSNENIENDKEVDGVYSDNDDDDDDDDDSTISAFSSPSLESSTPTSGSPHSPLSPKSLSNTQNLSRSSTIAAHSPTTANSGNHSKEADTTSPIHATKGLQVRFDFGADYDYRFARPGETPITPKPKFGLPEELDNIGWGRIPGWGDKVETPEDSVGMMWAGGPSIASKVTNENAAKKASNRDSSITILLDGYAYTA